MDYNIQFTLNGKTVSGWYFSKTPLTAANFPEYYLNLFNGVATNVVVLSKGKK